MGIQQCVELDLRLLAPGFLQSARNVSVDIGCVGSGHVWVLEDVNEMNGRSELSSQRFRGRECSFRRSAEINWNENASEPPSHGILPSDSTASVPGGAVFVPRALPLVGGATLRSECHRELTQ